MGFFLQIFFSAMEFFVHTKAIDLCVDFIYYNFAKLFYKNATVS